MDRELRIKEVVVELKAYFDVLIADGLMSNSTMYDHDHRYLATNIVNGLENLEITQFEADLQQEYFAECARAYNV